MLKKIHNNASYFKEEEKVDCRYIKQKNKNNYKKDAIIDDGSV